MPLLKVPAENQAVSALLEPAVMDLVCTAPLPPEGDKVSVVMLQHGLGLGKTLQHEFISLNMISLVTETHVFSLMGVPMKYEHWGSCSMLN